MGIVTTKSTQESKETIIEGEGEGEKETEKSKQRKCNVKESIRSCFKKEFG